MSEAEDTVRLRDGKLFRQQCYIDGAWHAADNGNVLEVTDPSTGAAIGIVPEMAAAETRRAIAAANTALPSWRALPAKERSAIVHR